MQHFASIARPRIEVNSLTACSTPQILPFPLPEGPPSTWEGHPGKLLFLLQNIAPGRSPPCLSFLFGVSFCTLNIFLLLHLPQCVLMFLLFFYNCHFYKIGFLGGRNWILHNWIPVPNKMPRKLLNTPNCFDN